MGFRVRFLRIGRTMLIVGSSVALVFLAFRLVQAGSLTPSSAPASTMHSLQEIYDSLVGTFDSSAVVASKQGDVMQVTKCIIEKITGGTPCP